MEIRLKDFDDADKWESGELGASEEHVKKASPEIDKAVDDALGLQLVSIRLQKALIEDLKTLSKEEGLGYQPFLRQILTKYVKSAKQARLATAGGR